MAQWGYDIKQRNPELGLAALDFIKNRKTKEQWEAEEQLRQGDMIRELGGIAANYAGNVSERNRMADERARLEAQQRGEKIAQMKATSALGGEDPAIKALESQQAASMGEGSGRSKIAQMFLGKRPEDYAKQYQGAYTTAAAQPMTEAQRQAAAMYGDVRGRLEERAEPTPPMIALAGAPSGPAPGAGVLRPGATMVPQGPKVDPFAEYGSVIDDPTKRVEFATAMGIKPTVEDINAVDMARTRKELETKLGVTREFEKKFEGEDELERASDFEKISSPNDFISPEHYQRAKQQYSISGQFDPMLTKDAAAEKKLNTRIKELEIRKGEAYIRNLQAEAEARAEAKRNAGVVTTKDKIGWAIQQRKAAADSAEDFRKQAIKAQVEGMDPKPYYDEIARLEKQMAKNDAEVYMLENGKDADVVDLRGNGVVTYRDTKTGKLMEHDPRAKGADKEFKPVPIGTRAGTAGTITGEGITPDGPGTKEYEKQTFRDTAVGSMKDILYGGGSAGAPIKSALAEGLTPAPRGGPIQPPGSTSTLRDTVPRTGYTLGPAVTSIPGSVYSGATTIAGDVASGVAGGFGTLGENLRDLNAEEVGREAGRSLGMRYDSDINTKMPLNLVLELPHKEALRVIDEMHRRGDLGREEYERAVYAANRKLLGNEAR